MDTCLGAAHSAEAGCLNWFSAVGENILWKVQLVQINVLEYAFWEVLKAIHSEFHTLESASYIYPRDWLGIDQTLPSGFYNKAAATLSGVETRTPGVHQ